MKKGDKDKAELLTAEDARIIRAVSAQPGRIAFIPELTDIVGGDRKDPRWHGVVPVLVKRRLLKRDAVMGMFPTWCVTKKGDASLAAFDSQQTAEAPT